MSLFPSSLAYKYARAFLMVFSDITPDRIKKIESVVPMLKKHRQTLLYVALLHEKYEARYGSLDQFFNHFNIAPTTKKLVHVLINDKRLVMLPEILQAIVNLYKEDHHITACTITSADTLSDQQKKALEVLLHKLIHDAHGTVEARYQTDQNLIAGVRVQTDTLLYEHSVEKQLRQANLLLVRNYRGY